MTLPIPEDVMRRIAAHDGSLYSEDPTVQADASAFMGWTHLARDAEALLPRLRSIAEEVRRQPLTDVVLLGMGGSSLAAYVMGKILAPVDGPRLRVLDTTSPISVSRALAETDPATTIHLVASKSGGTIEPNALYRIFRGRADGVLGVEAAGERFIALTDPGSSLEKTAAREGMLDCILTPPAVGGRYSALTAFGLMPALLAGIDVDALVAAARRVETAFVEGRGDLSLARAMTRAYDLGYDKLNLIAQPNLRPFGVWVEQLVAESLGKHGTGIVPVVELGPAYVDPSELDVVFTRNAEQSEKGSSVADEPPTVRFRLDDPSDLGGWFVLWEYSTAVAGVGLGVNPFDQPNVAQAKEATAEFLSGTALPAPAHVTVDDVELTAGGPLAAGGTVRQPLGAAIASLLDTAREGDYFALLAYVPNEPEIVRRLEDAIDTTALRTGIASCLELGPRYLHSTGQLHKGGPNTGFYLVLMTRDHVDVAVPGETWTLRALHDAQAEGDFATLAEHGRRVLRVVLEDASEAAIGRFADALAEAAAAHGLSGR